MRRTHLAAALVLAGLAACQSTYYPARFAPGPARTVVRLPEGAGAAEAKAWVAVRGVRRADDDTGEPARVEVEMELENSGELAFHLEQSSLELLSGDLQRFGAARIESEDPPRVEPGASTVLTLHFPMPDGRRPEDVDFRSLTLAWTLVFDGSRATTSTTFERLWRRPYYDSFYDPYYYGGWGCSPHVHVGVGFGVWR